MYLPEEAGVLFDSSDGLLDEYKRDCIIDKVLSEIELHLDVLNLGIGESATVLDKRECEFIIFTLFVTFDLMIVVGHFVAVYNNFL